MGTLSVAQQQIVEIAKAISTNDIWDEYCKRMGVATENEWLDVVQQHTVHLNKGELLILNQHIPFNMMVHAIKAGND